ncbi:hypothetical protein COW99_04250 [Candidatus Roizmanbacteria bacterium CG22_combo_CG10-13_8_21_14_all_38_20]|uniref:Polymerase beta nucleotidyltransferase domain-containing protein n=1 Tax=Candidatus Roizmanbacteria bacterium CG22_combo_CG10-13_8_21_14_all_38_20 TaxID=1974862 RepID=A0A2H0BV54_9BACT|nr:nucleotidyltransferase domain-containing protein [Candidatus Microgenomates bacterium]PIP61484.1 MAG: hypothetical protein COW99_04250 [Candidatus Roizmanbacteria bacterium CG22_combo_CG10-13_8_21_14_all_38_20]PJC30710.1 MAG: nucleotidyltransferase domain-containing protein [Candidatus Roizmanbacteria bacterium CG_4_9_14_0_2_um_filter_38_17]
MNIKYIDQQELKCQLLKLMSYYLDLNKHKIFLFGSRVQGNNMERSDIDLGIEGYKPISPETRLKILEAIDKLPILYSIDLVDFTTADNKFKTVAKRYIEYLN